VVAHVVGDRLGVAAEQSQVQTGVLDVVGDCRLDITAAQQVAEDLVDDGPLDHRVGLWRPVEFVEVVHPRALDPRANVGHVDDEVRFDDDPCIAPDRTLRLAPVLAFLATVDGHIHSRFEDVCRLGPLAPERRCDRVTCASVGPDRHLTEVALAVLCIDGRPVTDLDCDAT